MDAPLSSPVCDDRYGPENIMWTPLKSKTFISGIEEKIVYAEDRFKFLAQQLHSSRGIILQSQARGGGKQDSKTSLVQSDKEAESNMTHKRSPPEVTTNDGIQSSQGIPYPSIETSFTSLNSLDSPTHHSSQLDNILGGIDSRWMAEQRVEDSTDSDSQGSVLHADYLNTASKELFTDIVECDTGPSTNSLRTDLDIHHHVENCEAVTHSIQRKRTSKPNTPPDITKTKSSDEVVSCKKHISLGTMPSALSERGRKDVNVSKKGDPACYTDKGCFSVIASRTPSSEQEKNRSGQMEKSCHTGNTKVTKKLNESAIEMSSRAELNLKHYVQYNAIENTKKLVSDTNIEGCFDDAGDRDRLESSWYPQSKLNKKNSKDGISVVSKVRKVSSGLCETDGSIKRSKSGLNGTSKMVRMPGLKGKINVGEKKGKIVVDTTSKVGKMSSRNADRGNSIKTSKSHIGNLSNAARKSSSNDPIGLTKKSCKVNVANNSSRHGEIDLARKRSQHIFTGTSNVVKNSSSNRKLELVKRRSQHTFADTSNALKKFAPYCEVKVSKKRSQHIFTGTSNVVKNSTPNVGRGLRIQRNRTNIVNSPRIPSSREDIEVEKKRSKSSIASTSNVAWPPSPSDEMEVVKKRSRTTFDVAIKRNKSKTACSMQKKTTYSSPYSQFNINSKKNNTSQVKPKSPNPHSKFNGSSKKFCKATITSKLHVKSKPSTAPSRRNNGAQKTVVKQKVTRLKPPKKGSRSTIDIGLRIKQKSSKSRSQLGMLTKESRGSITSKYEKTRKHKKSQHHLKKHETSASKDNFSDGRSEINLETFVASGESERLRSNKTDEFINEPPEYEGHSEMPVKLLEGETQTTNLKSVDCFQGNGGTSEVIGKRFSRNFYQNRNHKRCLRAREDMPQDKSMGIGNEQSVVKANPLAGNFAQCASTLNVSQNQGIEYKNTVFILQKHYATPTISSQRKKVMKSPFLNMKRKVMPFIIASSTMPSHNINVQIQDVISLIRTKPFKSNMPDISDFLKPMHKSPLTSVPLDPANYSLVSLCKSRQVPRRLRSESMNTLSPRTQLLSISESNSKVNGWKQPNTTRHLKDMLTPQGDAKENICGYPLRTESNYQAVLDKYIRRPQDTSIREEENSKLDQDSKVETDGMKARRLLSEIICYVSSDFQQISENLETNSPEQVVDDKVMASLRAKVEQNTAIVDETMKILDEGKELQSKYKRLAHAVTQNIMFDPHQSVVPTLREPPLSARLRSLMLNIKNFKKELALE